MSDPILELCARSKDHQKLRRFREFHQSHPEVLDFLVAEIDARLEAGFPSYSIGSLWDYGRWKLELRRGPSDVFVMNDHLAPFYGRAIVILHPRFNGRAELRRTLADELFGTEIAEKPLPGFRYPHLRWKGGAPLSFGWRPKSTHIPTPVLNLRPDVHAR